MQFKLSFFSNLCGPAPAWHLDLLSQASNSCIRQGHPPPTSPPCLQLGCHRERRSCSPLNPFPWTLSLILRSPLHTIVAFAISTIRKYTANWSRLLPISQLNVKVYALLLLLQATEVSTTQLRWLDAEGASMIGTLRKAGTDIELELLCYVPEMLLVRESQAGPKQSASAVSSALALARLLPVLITCAPPSCAAPARCFPHVLLSVILKCV